MVSDVLAVPLQESLLVLLTFSNKHASYIRNALEPRLYGSRLYRDVAVRCYSYIDQYKKPPGEHLPDLFDDELRKDDDTAKELAGLISAIGKQRETVNEQYVLKQLENFVRQQSLKSSIITASDAIQRGTQEGLDEAETALQVGLRARMSVFSPGITLSQGLSAAFNRTVRPDVLTLGIQELDRFQLGPARGEFHLFIAPPKRGKSWWLVHCAKRALLQRLKVAYITLELSQEQIAQRMLQSIFSMTRRKSIVHVSELQQDELWRLTHVDHYTLKKQLSFDVPAARSVIEKELRKIRVKENLIIKQFPAGKLTCRGLENYMDMLEQHSGFVPDVVCLDYPDYMAIDPKNYRLEIGSLYNDLRGIAVERNHAMIVASRANREGAKARLVDDTHAAEDFSRIYTADTIFTYSQTKDERALGLARLFVTSTRVAERDRFVIVMGQAYPMGQFCLSSVEMSDKYEGLRENATTALSSQAPDNIDDDD